MAIVFLALLFLFNAAIEGAGNDVTLMEEGRAATLRKHTSTSPEIKIVTYNIRWRSGDELSAAPSQPQARRYMRLARAPASAAAVAAGVGVSLSVVEAAEAGAAVVLDVPASPVDASSAGPSASASWVSTTAAGLILRKM